jgi:hypothetical protein
MLKALGENRPRRVRSMGEILQRPGVRRTRVTRSARRRAIPNPASHPMRPALCSPCTAAALMNSTGELRGTARRAR